MEPNAEQHAGQTRQVRQDRVVDLNSTIPVDYHLYVKAKGWSRSKGLRKKPFLPVKRPAGFKDQIVPAHAEAVLAGERPAHLPQRRGRGHPRRTA
jgi:hypothetical protein